MAMFDLLLVVASLYAREGRSRPQPRHSQRKQLWKKDCAAAVAMYIKAPLTKATLYNKIDMTYIPQSLRSCKNALNVA